MSRIMRILPGVMLLFFIVSCDDSSQTPESFARPVNFSFQDKETGNTLEPKVSIEGNGQKVLYKSNIKLKPGEYTINISLKEYQSLEQKIEVAKAKEPYSQTFKMVPLARSAQPMEYQVALRVTNSLDNSAITPETATLGGKKLSESFAAGDYKLVIFHPGYKTYEKTVSLSGEASSLTVEASLSPKARKATFKVSSNFENSITADKILIDGNEFAGEITPGQHQISVVKKGYKKLEKSIKVPAGDQTFSADLSMEAAERKLEIVALDNASGKPISYDVMIDGKTWQNDTIAPGKRGIEIKSNNYTSFKKTFDIQPGTEAFQVKALLAPIVVSKAKREVVIEVFSQVEPDKKISPETIDFNNQGYTGAVQVEPGKYRLMILHPGHSIFTEEINVPSGSTTFTHKVTIAPVSRNIHISLRYDKEPENEEECTIYGVNSQQERILLEHNKKIMPGYYEIIVEQRGYKYTGDKKLFIPADLTPFQIILPMQKVADSQNSTNDANKTEGENSQETNNQNSDHSQTNQNSNNGQTTNNQTSDNNTKNPDQTNQTSDNNTKNPDQLADKTNETNNQENANQNQENTNQNQENTTEKTNQNQGNTNTEETPKEIFCSVLINVVSDFPNPGKVPVDTLQINGEDFTGGKLSPGDYELLVKKSGYQDIRETITIPEQEELSIEKKLVPKPRGIVFELRSEHGTPKSSIQVDDQSSWQKLSPGNHRIVVETPGYKRIEEEVFIDLGEEPYKYIRNLQEVPRKWQLTFSDTKTQQEIVPDVVLLDSKQFSVKEIPATLEPQQYKLRVKKQNYEDYVQDLKVLPGDELLTVKVALKPIEQPKSDKRKIEISLVSDSNPKEATTAEILTLNDKSYTPGMEVAPGEYKIVAWKSGHDMYEQKVNVEAGNDTQKLEIVLKSTPRKLNLYLEYDVKPTPSYPDCVVYATNIHTTERTELEDGKNIKPGTYELEVSQIGYDYNGSRQLVVETDNSAVNLTIKLTMKKAGSSEPKENPETKKNPQETSSNNNPNRKLPGERILIIKGIDQQTQEAVPPVSIQVEGKEYKGAPLKVGTVVKVVVSYKKYMTHTENIKIEEGTEDVLETSFFVVPLKLVVFTAREDLTDMDGIEYPYVFKIEDVPLEEQHVTKEKKEDKFYFYVYVREELKALNVYSGYRYREKTLFKTEQELGYLSNISSLLYTQHLTKLRQKQGNEAALESIEKLFKINYGKLRRDWFPEDKELLYDYVSQWRVEDENLLSRYEDIVQKLDRMLGN